MTKESRFEVIDDEVPTKPVPMLFKREILETFNSYLGMTVNSYHPEIPEKDMMSLMGAMLLKLHDAKYSFPMSKDTDFEGHFLAGKCFAVRLTNADKNYVFVTEFVNLSSSYVLAQNIKVSVLITDNTTGELITSIDLPAG